ncbi:MAG: SGNH/GDSL hydrolase family protein [Acidobacteria bacterium]|nr:SGNH/GDSL hydrolase family protein [Acidobacteriota bacterium]
MSRFGLRRTFLNLAVLIGTVLLYAAVLEGALRVIFARSLDFSMEMWKYAAQLKRPVGDPQLSFAHVPNRSAFLMGVQVSINSQGLRDHEYSHAKPSDVFRILMLGDSTALGWGVPLEQTVAKILERELNRTGAPGYRRVEVLNAGVGNYGTVQEVAHYRTYGRAFHPDLVILEYFINDAEPVPRERTASLLGRSYLVSFAVSKMDSLLQFSGLRPRWDQYYAGLYRDDPPALRAAQEALRELAGLTRRDGAKLLVALLPELHQINGGYRFAREHQKIKDVLAAVHTPAIELIEGLRGHGPESALWVTPDDPHPNGAANALIAAQIAPWILENVPGRVR